MASLKIDFATSTKSGHEARYTSEYACFAYHILKYSKKYCLDAENYCGKQQPVLFNFAPTGHRW
jgi:hypothetical protein